MTGKSQNSPQAGSRFAQQLTKGGNSRRILVKMRKAPSGTVFSSADFSPEISRRIARNELARLAAANLILRVSYGRYRIP